MRPNALLVALLLFTTVLAVPGASAFPDDDQEMHCIPPTGLECVKEVIDFATDPWAVKVWLCELVNGGVPVECG